jgi:hypothetical protein
MDRTQTSGLVVSGLAQVALGALTGIPYAIATYKPELLSTLRVRAPHRVRQLHLDLVMMGGLVTATGAAVPRIPRVVAVALAVGCWTNALAFAPPAIKPSIENAPAFVRWSPPRSCPHPPAGPRSPRSRRADGARPRAGGAGIGRRYEPSRPRWWERASVDPQAPLRRADQAEAGARARADARLVLISARASCPRKGLGDAVAGLAR